MATLLQAAACGGCYTPPWLYFKNHRFLGNQLGSVPAFPAEGSVPEVPSSGPDILRAGRRAGGLGESVAISSPTISIVCDVVHAMVWIGALM